MQPIESERPRCPGCAGRGVVVPNLTVRALVRDLPGLEVPSGEGSRICLSPQCDVVYFGPADFVARKTDVRIRVGIKELSEPITVCYCLALTRESIWNEVLQTGSCSQLARIEGQNNHRPGSCGNHNPTGICCIGAVRDLVIDAMAERKERLSRSARDVGGGQNQRVDQRRGPVG